MEAKAETRRKRLLGEILIEDGQITKPILEDAFKRRPDSTKRIGDYLIDMGFVTPQAVAMALAKQNNLAYIDLDEFEISPQVRDTIPEEVARKSCIVPIDRSGDTVSVAIADPGQTVLLDYIKLKTRLEVVAVMASENDILNAIEKLYAHEKAESTAALEEMIRDLGSDDLEVVETRHENDDEGHEDAAAAPIIRLANKIIGEAVRLRASDIHLEPKEHRIDLRYRIDGVLHKMPAPPKKLHNAIISRLKIMAECNIAEKRLPQDGRFKVKTRDKAVDFRVSFLPTIFGEKAVLRLLDKSAISLDLGSVGFEPQQRKAFEKALRRPNGIILLTGPTGSGKSTTLYAALHNVATPQKNVVTVEDPVEYQMEAINQVQAHSDIGLSFAEGLRTILRQDPDIVMIGEMRDSETASIAIKAAITGHLVFSTLHTNDAPGAISRLIDMGVEPYMVTASLVMVVAQRLVRRICPTCKEQYQPDEEELSQLGWPPDQARDVTFYRGRGCEACNRSGYRGRLAIHEILEMSEEVRHLVLERCHDTQIREFARQQGMMNLREAGLCKVAAGLTTIEEVLAATVEG